MFQDYIYFAFFFVLAVRTDKFILILDFLVLRDEIIQVLS